MVVIMRKYISHHGADSLEHITMKSEIICQKLVCSSSGRLNLGTEKVNAFIMPLSYGTFTLGLNTFACFTYCIVMNQSRKRLFYV